MKRKQAVCLIDSLEIRDVDGSPCCTLSHLHLTWHVGVLVDVDIHLLYASFLILSREVNLIITPNRLHAHVKPSLIQRDELIGIHG